MRSHSSLPRNAQAQIASQRLNEFRALYKTREEEYDELKALLPEQRELTMVLQGVQDRARSNGLMLLKFFPKEDVRKATTAARKSKLVSQAPSPLCVPSLTTSLATSASSPLQTSNLPRWKSSRHAAQLMPRSI